MLRSPAYASAGNTVASRSSARLIRGLRACSPRRDVERRGGVPCPAPTASRPTCRGTSRRPAWATGPSAARHARAASTSGRARPSTTCACPPTSCSWCPLAAALPAQPAPPGGDVPGARVRLQPRDATRTRVPDLGSPRRIAPDLSRSVAGQAGRWPRTIAAIETPEALRQRVQQARQLRERLQRAAERLRAAQQERVWAIVSARIMPTSAMVSREQFLISLVRSLLNTISHRPTGLLEGLLRATSRSYFP